MMEIGSKTIDSTIEIFHTLFEEYIEEINKAYLESDNFKVTFTVKIEDGENGHYLEPGISIPKGTIKAKVDRYFVSEKQLELFDPLKGEQENEIYDAADARGVKKG